MSRSWFVDQIGPSRVAANGAASVGIRRKTLNIITGGTAVDNPSKRRIDLTVPPASWTDYSTSLIFAGEWLPTSHVFVQADLVRVEATDPDTLLVGLDSGADPTKIVKFITNYGTIPFTIQPPASPVSGKQYFSGDPYVLAPNSTVRVVWDVVSRVYRVRGTTVVAPAADHILLGGDTIVLGTSPLSNPL
jgi:hypothetical protein